MKRLHLKFKHKLLVIVLVSIGGMVSLALIAWQGLNDIAVVSSYALSVEQSKGEIRQLQLEILRSGKLSEQEFTNLQQEQKSRLQNLQQLLSDQQAKIHLQELQTQLDLYAEQLHTLSKYRIALGSEEKGLVSSINQLGGEMEELFSGYSTVKQQLIKMRQMEKQFLLAPTSHRRAALANQFSQLKRRARSSRVLNKNSEILGRYEQLLGNMAAASVALEQQKELSRQQQLSLASKVTDTFTYLENELQAEAMENAKSSKLRADISLLAGTCLLSLVIALLLLWIGQGVRRSLTQVVSLMRQVADGDLTSRLEPNHQRNDEFDQLAEVANRMAGDLQNIIQEVVSSNQKLNQMSEQLERSVGAIAEANTEVAGESNSLAASAEEISITTHNVSQTTDELSTLSGEVHSISCENGQTITQAMGALRSATEVVGEANHSMGELALKSKSIDQVIDMINGLAEQTNLLALNAAIEAARAGDAGRGFAVVADEVRLLANHTVTATSKITDIVKVIQNQVDSVIEIMQQSNGSVCQAGELGHEAQRATGQVEVKSDRALDAVKQLAIAISEIASTSSDMAGRMDRIARNVQENRDATQLILTVVDDVGQGARKLEQLTQRFSY